MTDLIRKLLEQGLPTLMFVLGVASFGLAFIDIQFSPNFALPLRPSFIVPLQVFSLIFLLLSIGLWFLERKKPPDAEARIAGHYRLIAYLNSFVQVHDFRPPEHFSEALTKGQNHPALVGRACRYAAIYLELLGLLEANANGGEYRATAKADTLFKNDKFRARNADALRPRGA